MLKKWIDRFSNSVVSPIKFSLFYILYILICEIITRNFGLDKIAYSVLFLIGFSVYTYLIRYVFIMISHAGSGQKTSGEAVFNIILSVVTGIIFFAINYFYIVKVNPDSFAGWFGQNVISRLIGSIYYSVITFSTIGYGDIVPVSNLARIVVIGEVLYSLFILVLVISSFGAMKDAMSSPEYDHTRSRFSRQKNANKSTNDQ